MKKYHVILPYGMHPMPEPFELTAANILAGYFKSDVEFIPVSSDKTPDVIISGKKWEIKSPLGKGKYTIQHQLARASKQSKNIIVDARRCKLHGNRIRNQLNYSAKSMRYIENLLLITKDDRVEVIK